MAEELEAFRDQFRRFLAKELAPRAERWRQDKIVDRAAWRALGNIGALLPSVPEAYGGQGGTFAYDAAVIEDLENVVSELATGYSVHSTIVAHYILRYGSEEQKQRWLPKLATGDWVGAIAMTEPGTGRTCRPSAPWPGIMAMNTGSMARRPSSPTANSPT
jgi:acyl-CoA dehydrogenase